MNLKSILKLESVCFLKSKDKVEVLEELIQVSFASGRVPDLGEFREAVFYREKLMSTGIGYSIAIPHVRIKGIGEPLVSFGVQPEGVGDYQAIDQEPVKIVILIAVEKERHKDHVKLLSLFMHQLQDASFREEIINEKDLNTLFTKLINHD